MISIDKLRRLQAVTLCIGVQHEIVQSMIDFEYLSGFETTSIVATVGGNRKTERFFWGSKEIIIPVVKSIDLLPKETGGGINVVVNLLSGRRILESMQAAFKYLPNLELATIFAEQVPELHTLEVSRLAGEQNTLVLGPASVGLLIPGVMKVCAIGGVRYTQLIRGGVFGAGDTAVISTSGGMVNELIHQVTQSGHGISFAMALGGERYPITTPAQACLLAEADPETRQIVYFGELGGGDEYEISKLIKAKRVTKPIISYIAGTVAELFDEPPQFGHAKAIARSVDESARAKKRALKEEGAIVIDHIGDLNHHLKKNKAKTVSQQPTRAIHERHKHLIMSRVSGEENNDVQLLGKPLIETIEGNSTAGLVLSMLLGKQIKSKRLIEFTDFTFRLLVDHGPYVSGAINTIVTARAGRDLVSSLSAGLLTIGDRFGGALNESARCWLDGEHTGESPRSLVKRFADANKPIPGIGHKKYRIDLPDPRVTRLLDFAEEDSPHLHFALRVQAITTSKRGNLILNVDGAVAAIFLDLLQTELSYSYEQLHELVEIGFFNAFFVLSRSVGLTAHYLDQRRHDEGLVRLSSDEVVYIPLDPSKDD